MAALCPPGPGPNPPAREPRLTILFSGCRLSNFAFELELDELKPVSKLEFEYFINRISSVDLKFNMVSARQGGVSRVSDPQLGQGSPAQRLHAGGTSHPATLAT
jgi:hypothetical protein